DLQPRGDTADAADVDLHHGAGMALEIFAEVQVRIETLADGDGEAGVVDEPAVALDVVGRQRFLEPANVERLIGAGSADGLVDLKGLVGVGEDLEAWTDCLADGGDASHVLVQRPPDLELAAAEAVALGTEGVLDQRRLLEMQPAALGGVEPDFALGAAGHEVQRHTELAALQIPKRGVDGGEGNGGDGADRGGVGHEEEVAPDALDLQRLTAEQRRHQGAVEQLHHRVTTGADGVAVAGTDRAVGVSDADDRRFLRNEGLD